MWGMWKPDSPPRDRTISGQNFRKVIDIASARLHDQGLRYGYDKLIRDRIIGWKDPADFIHWHLDVEPEGRYEVILQYGRGVVDAGSRRRPALEPPSGAMDLQQRSNGGSSCPT